MHAFKMHVNWKRFLQTQNISVENPDELGKYLRVSQKYVQAFIITDKFDPHLCDSGIITLPESFREFAEKLNKPIGVFEIDSPEMEKFMQTNNLVYHDSMIYKLKDIYKTHLNTDRPARCRHQTSESECTNPACKPNPSNFTDQSISCQVAIYVHGKAYENYTGWAIFVDGGIKTGTIIYGAGAESGNVYAEGHAITRALDFINHYGIHATIYTDSYYWLNVIFKYIPEWSENLENIQQPCQTRNGIVPKNINVVNEIINQLRLGPDFSAKYIQSNRSLISKYDPYYRIIKGNEIAVSYAINGLKLCKKNIHGMKKLVYME